MITLHDLPIRRLLYLWRNNRGESVYLVETKNGRTQTVTLGDIGSDGGVSKILHIARFKAGQIMEESNATHDES